MSHSLGDADAIHAKATRAEYSADFDSAFSLYLSAAQSYLHYARGLPAQKEHVRIQCKTNAAKCLERAEKIKSARKDSLALPIRNPFSFDEQTYVLDKSSKVHGIHFPVWTNGGEPSDMISDLQPPLGDILLSKSAVWKGPNDVPSSLISFASENLQPYHIQQSVLMDCSVCSSIAICLHHHRNFGSRLGLSCIFPQLPSGMPKISDDGLYYLRFFVNGAFRKTLRLSLEALDDKLPFYPNGNLISVSTTHGFRGFDLWPSLLEKAYMKLNGGYDFPGSNSSIDMHAFTGWIPEHIETKSSKFMREKMWKQISDNFVKGLCVLTLGTGPDDGIPIEVDSLEGRKLRLLPAHSYAVLGVRQGSDDELGERSLTILNPWLSYNLYDEKIGAPSSIQEIQDSLQNLRISEENEATMHESVMLNLSWDDVCSEFDGIYLNWDPRIFAHQIQFHGSWNPKVRIDSHETQCVHYHLTLSIGDSDIIQAEATKCAEYEIWVLLTRHIVDKARRNEFISVHAYQLEQLDESGGHDGRTINTALKSTFTDNTHALARLSLAEPSAQIALVASYDGAYTDVCFTVQAFSTRPPLSWQSQHNKAQYERTVEGSFSTRSAGGNITYPTFMNNPQYRLQVHAHTPSRKMSRASLTRKSASDASSRDLGSTPKIFIRLVAEGMRNIPLNIMLVWREDKEKDQRVIQLNARDVIASSGAYSYGVAQTSAMVTPGDYSVIVSAFEPRHRGPFTLCVDSAVKVDIDAIPSEGAGMFCKTYCGTWSMGLDGGSPRFGRYHENPTVKIDIRSTSSLKLRLQLIKPNPSIAINITLYAAPSSDANHVGTFILGKQITTSGAYADSGSSRAGVATPLVTLLPGSYIAAASTFDPGARAEFQMLVFSSAEIQLSPIY